MKKYSYDGKEVSKELFEQSHENYRKSFPNHPLSHLNDYKLNSGILIESGSLYGDTIYRALNFGYKKVISIEINKELFHYVSNRFESEIKEGIVELHLGSSIDVLPKILKNINEPVTFWLDAHLHGNSFGKVHDAPIIQELDIIKSHNINSHNILVDDMRIIRTQGWGSGNMEQLVIDKVKNINDKYTITYGHGLVNNDVLIAENNG